MPPIISDAATVYENLARMCVFRGARVTARVAPDKFVAMMEADHYARIDADRDADDMRGAARMVIILFSEFKNIDSSAPKFGAFLARVLKERAHWVSADERAEFNIVLVFSSAPSSAIARVIAGARAPGIVIEAHIAALFMIVAPEHVCVPRHTIVPRAEVERICRELHLVIGNFPALIASASAKGSAASGASGAPDPMAVWLGLRPGMIVRIDRPCETAGIETIYRRCV
jgi:DNA-directed RNA polymerase subunit H (RpoH/RPB5)